MILVAGPRWHLLGVMDEAPPKPATPTGLRPGYLSRHVKADSMRSKGNGEVKAHPAILARLDALGDRMGPPPIVSGYRDPARNTAAGGARFSQHVLACAADIDEGYGLTVREAIDLGFSGIGYVVDTDVVIFDPETGQRWVDTGNGRRPSRRVDVDGTDADILDNVVVHVDVRAEGPNNGTGAAIGAPTLWSYG